MSRCVVTKEPAPLLNTADFAGVLGGKEIKLDEQGLFRPLETVLLPGALCAVRGRVGEHILEVRTEEYPYGSFYIDERLTSEGEEATMRTLPPKERTLEILEASEGRPYLWGGNHDMGVQRLLSLYGDHHLEGVDCSGLLYEATEGYTPRNTSSLLRFGEEVALSNVQPLDIIVWPGHVIIVFDEERTIESIHGKGVVLAPIQARLDAIDKKVQPVIRRFFL